MFLFILGLFKICFGGCLLSSNLSKTRHQQRVVPVESLEAGISAGTSGAGQSCPKKLPKPQPEPGIADLHTTNLREFGRLKAGHKPGAVKTGHLIPVLWQTLVLASFSPTEIFHLLC